MAEPSDYDGKTNVLILASSLRIGGAETVIQQLALTLDRRRFNVTVCYLKEPGQIGPELIAAGVDVVGILNSERADYFTFRKLIRVIQSRRIDVVHTHTTHGLVDATICKLFQWQLRVLHTFHFGNYPHTRPRIILMERVFSRFADRLFAVGEFQRQQLKALFGFGDDRIRTLHNGVRLFEREPDRDLRARIGAEGCVLIGTIATLIEQKGLFDLLRVARRLVDAGAPVKFAVVGEGLLRPRLEAMRAELKLEDTVSFVGWVTHAAERTLPVFDVFFQPSLWEAMSIVILEAMAVGKPIVASRVGENPVVIQDGVNGLLVNAKDIDGMASALLRLVGDPELRQRLGAEAARTAAERFSVEHMTRAYEQAYVGDL